MKTNRLEAFSDGVLAIIITIMVLELDIPTGASLSALWEATGVYFLAYVLSFVYVGIYWNNHHHVFQLVDRVSGSVLWANLHLLFWLSLLPFTTGWMARTDLAHTPTAIYATDLMMAGIAYWILELAIIRLPVEGDRYREAIDGDKKGLVSVLLCALSILLALWTPWLALVVVVGVAVMWAIPDRRIERYLSTHDPASSSRSQDA